MYNLDFISASTCIRRVDRIHWRMHSRKHTQAHTQNRCEGNSLRVERNNNDSQCDSANDDNNNNTDDNGAGWLREDGLHLESAWPGLLACLFLTPRSSECAATSCPASTAAAVSLSLSLRPFLPSVLSPHTFLNCTARIKNVRFCRVSASRQD